MHLVLDAQPSAYSTTADHLVAAISSRNAGGQRSMSTQHATVFDPTGLASALLTAFTQGSGRPARVPVKFAKLVGQSEPAGGATHTYCRGLHPHTRHLCGTEKST